jgi:glycosyltransferase involved in cell wall biosynthesis
MKTNIAFVIGQLTHGGSEKQLYLLCKGLDKKKYNIIVFCLSNNKHPWGYRIIDLGVKVIFISRVSRFDIFRIIKLSINFYTYSPDIIVSSLHTANVYSGLAIMLYQKPVKYLAQIRSKEDKISLINRYLNIYSFNMTDKIITNTKLLIPFIIDYYRQRNDKIIEISNAVSIQRSNVKINGDGKINIGIIGKDTEAKNIDLFIHLAIRILNTGKDVFFHLCGRGLNDTSRFKKNIPSDYKNKVIFYGELDSTKGFYDRIDIFLLTSISEGFPNVLLEAMSYGIPIISSNVGGAPDLIKHRENGLIFESNDLESLYKNVVTLMSDKYMREKFSKNGIDTIKERFRYESMIDKYDKVFQDVLK